MFTDASTAWRPGRPTPRKGDPAPGEPLSQLRRLCGQDGKDCAYHGPGNVRWRVAKQTSSATALPAPTPRNHSRPACMKADHWLLYLVRKRGRKQIGRVQCHTPFRLPHRYTVSTSLCGHRVFDPPQVLLKESLQDRPLSLLWARWLEAAAGPPTHRPAE